MSDTWSDGAKVDEYLSRMPTLAPRLAGEAALVELLPADLRRVVDLGCGDGRLVRLVRDARPGVATAVGLDSSPPMLERARRAFADDPTVEVEEHDLRHPLPDLGRPGTVVSGFAIHHLGHDRKASLFAEIAEQLAPAGVFANLDVVECATARLQEEFHALIGRPGGDPEDVLAPVEPQLDWMREAGLVDVDCMWRWRGFALMAGRKPPD